MNLTMAEGAERAYSLPGSYQGNIYRAPALTAPAETGVDEASIVRNLLPPFSF